MKITLNPPQTFMRNLFGQDLGALKATKCPQSNPHITHKASGGKLKMVIHEEKTRFRIYVLDFAANKK
jgi:hypothetical protein